jgi:hypothetical protein
MPDIFTSTPELLGDIGKCPRISFDYRVVDSSLGKSLISRNGGNSIVFPDILDSLTEAQRIDLYHYIGQWFINKDIHQINNDAPEETKEIIDTGNVNKTSIESMDLPAKG